MGSDNSMNILLNIPTPAVIVTVVVVHVLLADRLARA